VSRGTVLLWTLLLGCLFWALIVYAVVRAVG